MTDPATLDPVLEKLARGMIEAQDISWNSADPTGFGEYALDDIVFTSAVGALTIGRNAFVEQHRRLLSSIYRGSTIRQTIENFTFLSQDAMLVSCYARLEGAQQPPPGVAMIEGVIHLRPSQVLVRRGSWGIAAYINVAVRPGAAAIPQP